MLWRRSTRLSCTPRVPTFGKLPYDENKGREMDQAPTKSQELRAFLLLSVVMAPVLAVAVVSGYGFMVWMYQLLVAGPPGAKF